MYTCSRSVTVGAVIFTALVTAAHADPVSQSNIPVATPQIAQMTAPSVKLPPVVVHPVPQSWNYDPYTDGHGPRPSSMNSRKAEHYKVPVGYDSNVAMHPYTSGIGPCAEGAAPSQGCSHPTGKPIPASSYERPPFNQ
jgi:hypothetical protein